MSERNGDKARFARERKKKALQRQVIRNWRKAAKTNPVGATSVPGPHAAGTQPPSHGG